MKETEPCVKEREIKKKWEREGGGIKSWWKMREGRMADGNPAHLIVIEEKTAKISSHTSEKKKKMWRQSYESQIEEAHGSTNE